MQICMESMPTCMTDLWLSVVHFSLPGAALHTMQVICQIFELFLLHEEASAHGKSAAQLDCQGPLVAIESPVAATAVEL